MNAPTLSLRFSGISAAGEFVAAAFATLGTARAEIARDITVAATPAGIVMTTPEGFRLCPEIAAALTTSEALDAAAADWLEWLGNDADGDWDEAYILGTLDALNACRGMTGTAHDRMRLAAINARTHANAVAATAARAA